MIIVQIRGGLGNQFFTYALAYALSRKANMPIMLDKQLYQTFYKCRDFELEQFNIDTQRILMSRSLGNNKLSFKIYNWIHDFKLKFIYKASVIEEKCQFEFQNISVESGKNYYLSEGYWQNYKYFDKYREEIQELFTLKNQSTLREKIEKNQILTDNTVAVHVRRGDYKTFQGGKCLAVDYYKQAFRCITEKLGDNLKFLVFTDDVEFCRENLGFLKNAVYFSDVMQVSDVEEFAIMSMCRHFIIANSTFSWWAAYLSRQKNKVIIAPVVDFWTKDFYLPEWVTLNTNLEQDACSE